VGLALAVARRQRAVFAILSEPDEIVRLDLDDGDPTKVAYERARVPAA
jgi:hypothetical protein